MFTRFFSGLPGKERKTPLEISREKPGRAGGAFPLRASYRRKRLSTFDLGDLSAISDEPKKFLLKNFWARARDK